MYNNNNLFKLKYVTHSDDLLNYIESLTRQWNDRQGERLWCFYGSVAVFLYMKYIQQNIGNIFDDVTKKNNNGEFIEHISKISSFITDEYGIFRKPRDIDIIVKEEGPHETDILYENENNHKIDILHYRHKSIRALNQICFLSFDKYADKVPVYPLALLLEDVIEFEHEKETRKWDRKILESIQEKEKKGYILFHVENAKKGPWSAKKETTKRCPFLIDNDKVRKKLLFNNE